MMSGYRVQDTGYRIQGTGYRKIKKTALAISLLLLAFNFRISAGHAGTLSSRELIEKAAIFDGTMVKYKGEAVTAILNRGEYSWINVNDGDNAIGVWCRSSLAKAIKFLGDYKNRGDTVEVEGIFYRACPVHGGELDIHAERLNITQTGFVIKEQVDVKRLQVSVGLFVVTLLIAILFRRRL